MLLFMFALGFCLFLIGLVVSTLPTLAAGYGLASAMCGLATMMFVAYMAKRGI